MSFSQWRPHPWHGLSAGPSPPSIVSVFVEITPFDLVKYEVDKASGYLRVDRAQRTSRDDPIYRDIAEIADIPRALVDRLVHYFSNYKRHRPEPHDVSVGDPYGRAHAEDVITSAMDDYSREFPDSTFMADRPPA